jgi:hypothetical protein
MLEKKKEIKERIHATLLSDPKANYKVRTSKEINETNTHGGKTRELISLIH